MNDLIFQLLSLYPTYRFEQVEVGYMCENSAMIRNDDGVITIGYTSFTSKIHQAIILFVALEIERFGENPMLWNGMSHFQKMCVIWDNATERYNKFISEENWNRYVITGDIQDWIETRKQSFNNDAEHRNDIFYWNQDKNFENGIKLKYYANAIYQFNSSNWTNMLLHQNLKAGEYILLKKGGYDFLKSLDMIIIDKGNKKQEVESKFYLNDYTWVNHHFFNHELYEKGVSKEEFNSKYTTSNPYNKDVTHLILLTDKSIKISLQ
jgi:hypothetical protein